MKRELLIWSPSTHSLFLPSISSFSPKSKQSPPPIIRASLDSAGTEEQDLSAKERRQLRNERRASKAYNWREEVEERLIKKRYNNRYVTLAEKINLDTLAELGPRWWIVRVTRNREERAAELIYKLLARDLPDFEFKIYMAKVEMKNKLKSGKYSTKTKQLYPGCVFLRCVLNRQIHNFIKEINGVGGFIGAMVGNTLRQINKPRPVSEDDMEALFKQVKEEQEHADKAFLEEQLSDAVLKSDKLMPKRRTRKSPGLTESKAKAGKRLSQGSKVRVLSGAFAEFNGILQKLNRKTKTATVMFTVFGKETLADLDVNDIVLETN